ncbi:MAG: copper chaperone PCu(A)C [Woeseiaceae bacterium]
MNLFKNMSLLLIIFYASTSYAANNLKFENTWSPEAPPVAKVMAGYMIITNSGTKDVHIVSAKSPLFKKVEIHLTQMKNGMMTMVKQENLTIKAKSYIELKPGGLHMMLMGKLKKISAGSAIPVTLTFDHDETVSIKLKIKTDRQPKMKCGSGKCGSM